MFDVATRSQPAGIRPAALLSVPFDWRLAAPVPAAAYPWTDYTGASGTPQMYADVLATYSLELEDTLQTAVIISLFTDRRAGRDDKLPLNQTDRRGWVGNEFMSDTFDARVDEWGSGLWLCYTTKTTGEVLERARFETKEALAWMVRGGIASRIEAGAEWVDNQLAVRPAIYKPGQLQPVYDVLWGTSLMRGGMQ